MAERRAAHRDDLTDEPQAMTEPTLTFADQTAWDTWLAAHGEDAGGVWLRIAKKAAAQSTVSYAEAVEAALCHGWIDGQKRAYDQHYWLQRFTPRTAKSIWSEINRAKAEALIAAGRMQAAGRREVERAKRDGRWDAAYPSARTATVPADLKRALDSNPDAKRFFADLDGQNRYAILFRLHHAKRAETRARKIAQFIEMLNRGEKIHR